MAPTSWCLKVIQWGFSVNHWLAETVREPSLICRLKNVELYGKRRTNSDQKGSVKNKSFLFCLCNVLVQSHLNNGNETYRVFFLFGLKIDCLWQGLEIWPFEGLIHAAQLKSVRCIDSTSYRYFCVGIVFCAFGLQPNPYHSSKISVPSSGS